MHPIDGRRMAESRSSPPRIPAAILAHRRVPPESQQGGIRLRVSGQEIRPTSQLGDSPWGRTTAGSPFKVPIGDERPGGGLRSDTVMGGEEVRNKRAIVKIVH